MMPTSPRRPEIVDLASPFTGDAVNVLRDFVGRATGRGTGIDSSVDRRLLGPAADEEAVLSFVESALPAGELESRHCRMSAVRAWDRARVRTRAVESWSRCIELWTDALGRPDLSRLAGATRVRVAECEALLGECLLATQRGGSVRAGQREGLGDFVLELRGRFEPWARLFGERVAKALRVPFVARMQGSRNGATRELVGAFSRWLRRASETADTGAFAKVCLLSVPGIRLADVREIVQPAGLHPTEWHKAVMEIHSLVGGAARMFRARAAEEPAPDAPGAWRAARVRDETRLSFFEASSSACVLLPSWATKAAVAGLWVESSRCHVEAVVKRIVSGLRARFRQTGERYYQRAAIPFRVLDEKCADWFKREVRAARRQRDPSGEGELHRWFAPHLGPLKRRFPNLYKEVLADREEFEAITFATMRGMLLASRHWQDPRWRHVLDSSWSSRVGTLKSESKVAAIPRWIDTWGGAADVQTDRGTTGTTGAEAALEGIWSILRPNNSSSFPADASATAGECGRRRSERFKLRRADPFLCLLLAQRAILRQVESDCAPFKGAWSRAGRQSTPAQLPTELLLEALTGLEVPLRRTSYIVVRLVLALDLRLAFGLGPDLTFIKPIWAPLHDAGGERLRRLLEAHMLGAAHQALLARERRRVSAPVEGGP